MQGYIKIFRQIENNPLYFSEKFTRAQAWIDLLLLANHKENKFLKRGCWVTIKRGQVGWSILALSERWKWSRHKVDDFLLYLQKEQQILIEKTHLTTIISVCNYETYQGVSGQKGQQKDKRRTTEGQQKDTNNNEKNVNKNNYIYREKKKKIENEKSSEAFERFKEELNEAEKYKISEYINQQTDVYLQNDEVEDWMKKYILKIQAEEDIYRTNRYDYKKHFNNWLIIQIEKNKKNESDNNNRQRKWENLIKRGTGGM